MIFSTLPEAVSSSRSGTT